MRQKDLAEILAFGFSSAYDAVKYSVDHSLQSYTWLVGDRVGCIGGFTRVTVIDDRALPWLLSTAEVEKKPIEFLRGTKKMVQDFMGSNSLLASYVDSRYAIAINWIKWMGFKVGEPEPIGPNGELFCKFEMSKS